MTQQTGPDSGAPTVQQGGPTGSAERTRQQGAEGERTRQQTTDPGERTRRQGSASGAGNVGTPTFPATLRSRFEPLELRGSGTEGAVWRCRRVEQGDEIAVKVHFAGRPIDQDLLRHLDNPRFVRHVPHIHDYGTFFTDNGEIGWVAMEYLAENLQQHIGNRASRPFDAASTIEIVRDLAAALYFWQQVVERNPLDFKPDNLMIRTGADAGFVLTDFGGVAAFTASQQIGGNAMAAIAYTPPEQYWEEKRSPWPWWSLGEIVYLLVTGHTRFQHQPDQVIRHSRMMDSSVDVSDIADERWKLLVRGLLTKEPQDRWGWAEVNQWCHGGSPEVVDHPHGSSPADEPSHRPITFGDGRSFNDPGRLAEAMLDDWRTADTWLTTDGRQTLLDWLRQEHLDKRFDTGHLRGIGNDPDRADRAILAFGAAFARDTTPRWRGDPIDVNGLIRLLGQHPGTVRRFDANQILGLAADYRCGHAGCVDRCVVLDRAETAWRRLTLDAESAITDIDAGPETSRPLSDGERDRLSISLLWLLLAPEQAAAVLRPSRKWTRFDRPWWRRVLSAAETANPGIDAGRVAIAIAVVLDERAADEARRIRIENGNFARQRSRRVARPAGAALLLFLAVTAASWLGAVFSMADSALGPDAAIAVAHADTVRLALLVPLFLVAVETVLFGLRRPTPWLVGAVVLAAMLGALASRLPSFDAISPPSFIAAAWSALSGIWNDQIVISCLAFGGLALACLVGGIRLLEHDARPARTVLLRHLPAGRRLTVLPLSILTLLLAVWVAGVMRYTLFDSTLRVPFASIGALLADYQSGFLPAILIVAALSAVAWPRTRWVLGAGVCAAVVVATGSVPGRYLTAVWYPLAWTVLGRIGSAWGDGAIWAALLVYLPLAVLCVSGMNRLAVR